MGVGFFLAIGIALFAVFWYFGVQAVRKRRDAMALTARQLGLGFHPDKDYRLDEQYSFLSKLCQGENRYGFNMMAGEYRQHPVMVFDYHYETTSTDSKGNRSTTNHHFSFFILHFNAVFPELLISREGWLSKLVQFVGFDDIDFESAEFSRKFLVKSSNKKFAYDICHGRMIEFLLNNNDLNIEIERSCLTLFFNHRLQPAQVQPNLERLITIRDLFPDYLMARQS